MKKTARFVLLLSLAPLFAGAAILPTPKSEIPAGGSFRLTADAVLSHAPELERLADYLCGYLHFAEVSDSRSADGGVALVVDPSLGEEAYELTVRPDRIVIAGGDSGGVFNGIQTLFELLPSEIYAGRLRQTEEVAIPCVRISDAPKFHYRGMMLDVARTWIGIPAVKRYIDLFSHHKINKLHLHLADDEGWRIEILSHPELTEVGAWRGGDSPVQAVYGKWDEKYGGFFTQQELRELIDYAAVRNIEIIPEIDLPGHSRDIACVHPEIRCDYPHDTSPALGYDYRSAWCVAREENYGLLADILGEICRLFPSPYIHIGGDEVETDQWMQCPDCRALMRREGITEGMQLQGIFLSRVDSILRANGKLPATWNESVETGRLRRDGRVYGWADVKSCLKATAAGYETVVMPACHFYFDMRQTPREDGHDWAAVFDAEGCYAFDFDKYGFSADQQRRVVGLQGAFWSEAYVSHHPETPDYLDYMLFPRLCVLAEMAWSGKPKPWTEFRRELIDSHYERLAGMDVRFRLFPPKLRYEKGCFTATVDDGSEIWYTVDPDTAACRYTAPLRTDEPYRYAFHSRYRGARSPETAAEARYRLITPEVALTSSMRESAKAPFERVEQYRSFAWTTRACRSGDWFCFTFAQPIVCREIAVQTGNRQLPKAIFTTGRVEISYDDGIFEPAGELEKGSVVLRPDRPVRALRVTATTDGNGCPFVTLQPLRIKPER